MKKDAGFYVLNWGSLNRDSLNRVLGVIGIVVNL